MSHLEVEGQYQTLPDHKEFSTSVEGAGGGRAAHAYTQ